MTRPDVEHLRVAADNYVYHHRNHTIATPDPECVYCDGRLIDATRIADGVIYLDREDER